MPTLSVIIPVHNAEPYLAKCLDSIVSQDDSDYEVVLVDDGSTDDSRAICESYAARYDRVAFLHKENGGVSSARNMGLERATGEYICFVDADDWVEQDYIPTLFPLLTDGGEEGGADILFFGMRLIHGANEETINPTPVFCKDRKSAEEVIYALRYGGKRDIFGWTWDKVFKADIIRNHHIRFPEDVRFREDEIFTFEFCRYITSLRVIDHPLYNYRLGDTGLTAHGMGAADYLPSSIALESSIAFFRHEGIREHMLHSITSYRALHIYKRCQVNQVKRELEAYEQLTHRLPQPGRECPICHLTSYLQKGFWIGFLYCLIRRL